jgi:hypothetical protein
MIISARTAFPEAIGEQEISRSIPSGVAPYYYVLHARRQSMPRNVRRRIASGGDRSRRPLQRQGRPADRVLPRRPARCRFHGVPVGRLGKLLRHRRRQFEVSRRPQHCSSLKKRPRRRRRPARPRISAHRADQVQSVRQQRHLSHVHPGQQSQGGPDGEKLGRAPPAQGSSELRAGRRRRAAAGLHRRFDSQTHPYRHLQRHAEPSDGIDESIVRAQCRVREHLPGKRSQ